MISELNIYGVLLKIVPFLTKYLSLNEKKLLNSHILLIELKLVFTVHVRQVVGPVHV
jgi:hypothetical protein